MEKISTGSSSARGRRITKDTVLEPLQLVEACEKAKGARGPRTASPTHIPGLYLDALHRLEQIAGCSDRANRSQGDREHRDN
jgi:hypothetical protein